MICQPDLLTPVLQENRSAQAYLLRPEKSENKNLIYALV